MHADYSAYGEDSRQSEDHHMQNSQAWPACSTPSFMHPGNSLNGTVHVEWNGCAPYTQPVCATIDLQHNPFVHSHIPLLDCIVLCI